MIQILVTDFLCNPFFTLSRSYLFSRSIYIILTRKNIFFTLKSVFALILTHSLFFLSSLLFVFKKNTRTSTLTLTYRIIQGGLAFLASRRNSRDSIKSVASNSSLFSNEDVGPLAFQASARGRQRRTSNFLELPGNLLKFVFFVLTSSSSSFLLFFLHSLNKLRILCACIL